MDRLKPLSCLLENAIHIFKTILTPTVSILHYTLSGPDVATKQYLCYSIKHFTDEVEKNPRRSLMIKLFHLSSGKT